MIDTTIRMTSAIKIERTAEKEAVDRAEDSALIIETVKIEDRAEEIEAVVMIAEEVEVASQDPPEKRLIKTPTSESGMSTIPNSTSGCSRQSCQAMRATSSRSACSEQSEKTITKSLARMKLR